MRRRRITDEIRALEREIDRSLEERFHEQPMWDISTGELEPLAHVSETQDKVTVTMDLPLVKKENIHISVTRDEIEVKAEMERCVKYDRWGTVQRECEFKSFHKLIRLPEEVLPDGAKAKFKHGVLTVELPKKAKPRAIPIE